MTNTVARITFTGVFFLLVSNAFGTGRHPIDIYYKQHRFDQDMEAKHVPPKLASLFVDEDYKDAIDLLQSLNALKYLNYYGEKAKISEYADNAAACRGTYESLYDDVDGNREVRVFGEKKDGNVTKLFAVVETKTQFLLLIGRGKLSRSQVRAIPDLSKEIQ